MFANIHSCVVMHVFNCLTDRLFFRWNGTDIARAINRCLREDTAERFLPLREFALSLTDAYPTQILHYFASATTMSFRFLCLDFAAQQRVLRIVGKILNETPLAHIELVVADVKAFETTHAGALLLLRTYGWDQSMLHVSSLSLILSCSFTPC